MKTFFKPLVTVLALTFAVSGFAQTEAPGNLQVVTSNAVTKFDTNVHIVRMKEDPVLAYKGGNGKLKATKPQKGKKINPNSSAVKKYVAYLDSRHDDVMKAIGAGEKIYDYRYALNGFAAVLTPGQVEAARARDDVINVRRDELRQLNTDSTPAYLGLSGGGGVWETIGKGDGVIVGMLDTGISPEHQSFSDQIDLADRPGNSGKRTRVYGPPPAGWNGTCQSGEQWSQDDCNNKLIGARYFHAGFGSGNSGLAKSEILSARDTDGHGSHTSSTATGNEGAINTIDGDPVSGIAPRARVAIYKVCWNNRAGAGGCASSDSAAAIDAAVADGVDVINFSIGGSATSFGGADDIAFLFAADAGVWVATSNGNAGPGAQTTGTPAGVPWITAVGAAQDNEVFGLVATVNSPVSVAGNKDALEGTGPIRLSGTGTISEDVVSTSPANGCSALTNGADVAGKIALTIRGVCSFAAKYNNAAAEGATAIIVYNDGANSSRIDPIFMGGLGSATIPGVMIGFNDGDPMAAAAGVTATLDPNNVVSRDNRIAGFSSRGPNGGAPDVIKPDVAAPGVQIIAAGAGTGSIRISGTSMSSPHVAGLFALLKEQHPGWSAADAKSAVMTSGRQDLKKTFGDTDADPFDIGAGHVVPAGAFEPGLVYDADLFDYIRFLCGSDFQSNLVSAAGCAFFGSIDSSDLNLASIGVANLIGSQTVTRHVTSVTEGTTTFTASWDAPVGIDVAVSPSILTMDLGDTESFTVTLSANADADAGNWTFGSLTWANDAGVSPARSPIAVNPAKLDAPAAISGTGPDGAISFDIGFGYAGVYSAGTHGLVPANREADNVVDDPNNSFAFFGPGTTLHTVVIPSDTQVARWSLFNEFTDGNDDLDLYVFHCPGGLCTQVGSSGNSDSNEEVTLINPVADLYAIFVHGWQTDGADSDYTLFEWAIGVDAGNMMVTAPASATLGAVEPVSVSWSGLDSGKKYLGSISHNDDVGVISQTIISINTE